MVHHKTPYPSFYDQQILTVLILSLNIEILTDINFSTGSTIDSKNSACSSSNTKYENWETSVELCDNPEQFLHHNLREDRGQGENHV